MRKRTLQTTKEEPAAATLEKIPQAGMPAAIAKGGTVVSTDYAQELIDSAGTGMETIGRDDYAIPMLKLIQALSPEKTKGDAKYLLGVEEGDFVDSISSEVFKADKPMRVVRVAVDKRWIEWRPRKSGGGLVKVHATEVDAKRDRIPAIGNPDTDTIITETAQIYVCVQT